MSYPARTLLALVFVAGMRSENSFASARHDHSRTHLHGDACI